MKDKGSSIYGFLFKAGSALLGLLIVLSVLTSLKTGISLFNKEIIKAMSTVFSISLGIMFILLAAMLAGSFFMGQSPARSGSIVAKDNTLKYESADFKKTRRRKTVDISTLDSYLNKHKQLYIIDGLRLAKKDSERKSNVHNLMAGTADDKMRPLSQIAAEDKALYERICRYLDFVAKRSEEELYWHGESYCDRFMIIEEGEKILAQLQGFEKNIKDQDIKASIRNTAASIEQAKTMTDQISSLDKAKRLHTSYLSILLGALQNYQTFEKEDADQSRLLDAKAKLLSAFKAIDEAYPLIYSKDSEDLESPEQTDLDEVLLGKKNG